MAGPFPRQDIQDRSTSIFISGSRDASNTMFRDWLEVNIYVDQEQDRSRVIADFIKPLIKELDERKENYEFHILPLYARPENGTIARYLTFRLRGNEKFLTEMENLLAKRIQKMELITGPLRDRSIAEIKRQNFETLRNSFGEEGWSICEEQLKQCSKVLLRLFDAYTNQKINEKQCFDACCYMCHYSENQFRTAPIGAIQRLQQQVDYVLIPYDETTGQPYYWRFP